MVEAKSTAPTSMSVHPQALASRDPEDHIAAFQAIVGAGGLYRGEAMGNFDPGFAPDNLAAGILIAPDSSEDIAAILKLCSAQRISVVPHGGRTGLSGGAASSAGQVVLSLHRMNRILDINPLSATAVVEAGATLQSLAEAAAAHGLAPGIDLGARGTATLGGMLSTNAGGTEAFRNGVMRHQVLGLEAVLADGTILSELSKVTKANEGYDLKQLFIGAEGTLGVISRVAVRLKPRIEQRTAALVACSGATPAVEMFNSIAGHHSVRLLNAEIMWRNYFHLIAQEHGGHAHTTLPDTACYVLFEIDATRTGSNEDFSDLLGKFAECGLLHDALIARNERERQAFWRIREDSFAIERRYPHGLWYDVSVPISDLDTYVEAIQLRVAETASDMEVFIIGHLGDGNLHLTISNGCEVGDDLRRAINDAIYRDLKGAGGSFSAEHGIGRDKREALLSMSAPAKVALMRQIKSVFDPANIMNPGKLL